MKPKKSTPPELDRQMAPTNGCTLPLRWYAPDQTSSRLSGFVWYAQDRKYRRLPLAVCRTVRSAVDQLADCCAGGQIAFQSDTRRLAVRVQLAAPACMNHMPATG